MLVILSDVAKALSAALAANIVHMDVSADNVMVDDAVAVGTEPRAVLTDFGCAKELSPDSTLTVALAHTRTFSLEGDKSRHAPELFIELEAAKREVRATAARVAVRWPHPVRTLDVSTSKNV